MAYEGDTIVSQQTWDLLFVDLDFDNLALTVGYQYPISFFEGGAVDT
jgi:hypothetical protein